MPGLFKEAIFTQNASITMQHILKSTLFFLAKLSWVHETGILNWWCFGQWIHHVCNSWKPTCAGDDIFLSQILGRNLIWKENEKKRSVLRMLLNDQDLAYLFHFYIYFTLYWSQASCFSLDFCNACRSICLLAVQCSRCVTEIRNQ